MEKKAKSKRGPKAKCHICASPMKEISEVQGRQVYESLKCSKCHNEVFMCDSGEGVWEDSFIELVKEYPDSYLHYLKFCDPEIDVNNMQV